MTNSYSLNTKCNFILRYKKNQVWGQIFKKTRNLSLQLSQIQFFVKQFINKYFNKCLIIKLLFRK